MRADKGPGATEGHEAAAEHANLPKMARLLILPTRRVRDAVGPSPAAARVERCVYITNPLMVRPNGSPAPATARQRGFQLPLLIKMFCNQSCGNKHMDMLNLLLG